MRELEQIKALLLKIVDCKNIHGNQHVFCDGTCPCPCNKPFQPPAKTLPKELSERIAELYTYLRDKKPAEYPFAKAVEEQMRLSNKTCKCCPCHCETDCPDYKKPADQVKCLETGECWCPQHADQYKPAEQLCGCPPSAGQLGHSCKLSERPPLPAEVEFSIKSLSNWIKTEGQTANHVLVDDKLRELCAIVRESDEPMGIDKAHAEMKVLLHLDVLAEDVAAAIRREDYCGIKKSLHSLVVSVMDKRGR